MIHLPFPKMFAPIYKIRKTMLPFIQNEELLEVILKIIPENLFETFFLQHPKLWPPNESDLWNMEIQMANRFIRKFQDKDYIPNISEIITFGKDPIHALLWISKNHRLTHKVLNPFLHEMLTQFLFPTFLFENEDSPSLLFQRIQHYSQHNMTFKADALITLILDHLQKNPLSIPNAFVPFLLSRIQPNSKIKLYAQTWPKEIFVHHLLPKHLNLVNISSFYSNEHILNWYQLHHKNVPPSYLFLHLFDTFFNKSYSSTFRSIQISICSNRGLALLMLSFPTHFQILLDHPACFNGLLLNPHCAMINYFQTHTHQIKSLFQKHFCKPHPAVLQLHPPFQKDISCSILPFIPLLNREQLSILLYQAALIHGPIAAKVIKEYLHLVDQKINSFLINQHPFLATWLIESCPHLIDLAVFATNPHPNAISFCQKKIAEIQPDSFIHHIRLCENPFPLFFELDKDAMKQKAKDLAIELLKHTSVTLYE